jgi:hypothetical protein
MVGFGFEGMFVLDLGLNMHGKSVDTSAIVIPGYEHIILVHYINI